MDLLDFWARGKTEIAKTVFGLFGDDYAGSIYLNGEKLRLKSPVHAIKKHIGLGTGKQRPRGFDPRHVAGQQHHISVITSFF